MSPPGAARDPAGPVLNVAYVIGRLNVGGAEAELVRLANGLDRARFRPFVVTLQDRGPLAEGLHRDVEVVELGRRRKWSIGTFRALRRALKERRPDISQSFLFTENIFCRWIGEGAVVSGLQGSLSDDAETGRVRAGEVSRIEHPGAAPSAGGPPTLKRAAFESQPSLKLFLERATFGRARAVVSNSEHYRTLYGRLGMDASRIRVIRSGVAPSDATGQEVRRSLGIPPDGILVACVARLVERKGHEDVIRAGAGFRLLFAGDGPMRRRLEGRGAILAGNRRDVPEIMAASDIVVLASRFGEGCPNAVLEAMAAGRPVVATRVGGVPEVVVDGETGLLVPPGDVPALRAALVRLAGDPALRARLGTAGRRRALEEFPVERMVKLHEDLYFNLTNPAVTV